VDKEDTLHHIFKNVDALIATHCEDEYTIKENLEAYKNKFGNELKSHHHPIIRNEESCIKSSSFAVELAKKYNTRLHVLHISTSEELALFTNEIPLHEKRITSEVCVHHLYFTADDYLNLGNKIKCNPAIKQASHAPKLFEAMLNDTLDIIATDHAPHTLEEKQLAYLDAPSGLPLIQHTLDIMMNFVQEGKLTPEKVIEKMCHAPANCFKLMDRGYIRENYYADIVIYNPIKTWQVESSNILYKCAWSPLEGKSFTGKVDATFVNGKLIYDDGNFHKAGCGHRLKFKR
jgi:dihydroorotase